MKNKKKSIEAFSLVEVTFALAIVVFCMVTVFGMLAVGVTTTQTSSSQTIASQVLNGISADIQSTPQIHGASSSPVYNIPLPLYTKTAITTPQATPLYIDEDGTTNTSSAGARYRLFYWTTSAATNNTANPPGNTRETLVRLILAWPAGAQSYTNAQGYVENVVAVNRTP